MLENTIQFDSAMAPRTTAGTVMSNARTAKNVIMTTKNAIRDTAVPAPTHLTLR
jgi:hypothetical protein